MPPPLRIGAEVGDPRSTVRLKGARGRAPHAFAFKRTPAELSQGHDTYHARHREGGREREIESCWGVELRGWAVEIDGSPTAGLELCSSPPPSLMSHTSWCPRASDRVEQGRCSYFKFRTVKYAEEIWNIAGESSSVDTSFWVSHNDFLRGAKWTQKVGPLQQSANFYEDLSEKTEKKLILKRQHTARRGWLASPIQARSARLPSILRRSGGAPAASSMRRSARRLGFRIFLPNHGARSSTGQRRHGPQQSSSWLQWTKNV